MKRKAVLSALSILAVLAVAGAAPAGVFTPSGGGLQSLFSQLGYDYIDVASYQTDLNFRMRGVMHFEVLSRSSGLGGAFDFGVLETENADWGLRYRHHRTLDGSAGVGATASFTMDDPGADYGFFIGRPGRGHGRYARRMYSFSPFNRNGAVQALFYADPLNENTYLLAWDGIYTGSRRSDRSYDDLVLRVTIQPAPEPAAWILALTGLAGVGAFLVVRSRFGVG